ncbi:MAG: universal stress protein [Gammaproteobacteria bacterium]
MTPYRHIVCATDFSEASQRACVRATVIANCFGARLTLLHVVENFPEDRSNDVIAPEDADPRHYRESEARDQLMKTVGRVGCPDAGRVVRFTTQSAWHEIVRFSREVDADLLVIADHAHSARLALGTTTAAEVAAHPPCDVLMARAPAEED